jgi:MFS family permease
MIRLLANGVSALRESQFRRLFLGRAISMLGTNIVPVALAFAVLDDLDGSATDLGIVLAMRWIAQIVLLLVGGVWADRLPRQLVMLTADAIRAGTQTLIGVLLVTGDGQLWQLALTQTVSGACDAFFNPASTGLVPHTVAAERLQQANALLSLTASSTLFIGPAIGGALVTTVGAGWAFVVDGGTFLASALFLAALHLPARARTVETPDFLADLLAGWREFRAQRWMVAIDSWAVLANMLVIGPFFVLGPVVAKQELGGASSWAVIVACFGVGAIVGDLAVIAIRPRRPLVFGCAVVATFALPPALLAVPAATAAIATGTCVAAFGLTVFNTLFVTTMQEQVPPEALSRVTAYDWLASVAFLPLGYALAGPLADLIGIRELLVVGALFEIAGSLTLVALPSVRAVERRLSAPSAHHGARDAPTA